MNRSKLKVERWETICSNLKEIFFFSLVDTGELVFTVRDTNYKYEFTFEKYVGPYLVVDEALRSELLEEVYWKSHTYTIENSDLIQLFNQGLMDVIYLNRTLKHYVISTSDTCLEILSEKEPIIKRILIEN